VTTPMNGMLQFVANNLNSLVPTTSAAVLSAVAAYGGTEIESNSEHIAEAFQMLTVKATFELGLESSAISYYYYLDNNNAFFVIAGPAGLSATNQIQPYRAVLRLVLDANGNILSAGDCYVTDLAFPPASPFAHAFV
jgi:hypothetical protein